MTNKAAGAVELTPKQARFVEEYLKDLNATQAYKRAGYTAKGNAAEVNAARLLSNAKVQRFIQERMQERSQQTQIDTNYVLNRLVEIDQMDVLDILEDDGSLKPVREWPQAWRRYLSGMDVAEMFEGQGDERKVIGVLKKIKWPDKLKNLDLLGRHVDVQAWKERVEHDISDRMADKIVAARKRARNGGDD